MGVLNTHIPAMYNTRRAAKLPESQQAHKQFYTTVEDLNRKIKVIPAGSVWQWLDSKSTNFRENYYLSDLLHSVKEPLYC